MALDPLTAALDLGKDLINKIWPDPSQRAEQLFKLKELEQKGDLAELNAHVGLMMAQIKVNETEAAHPSIFVGGWRPAIGWVCAAAIAYNYLIYSLLQWALAISGSSIDAPALLDLTDLWPLILGMLGISVSRSWEKRAGVQTNKTGK